MPQFRPASPEDPDARALLEEYFALRASIFPGGGYVTAFPSPAAFTPPAGEFVVADAEGAPIGCGGIRRVDDGPVGIRYEIKHLFVRPGGRGNGCGAALLAELERRATGFGAAEVVLDTHHSLEAAGALYARAGYLPIEPYNDNPNATVWLRKTLG